MRVKFVLRGTPLRWQPVVWLTLMVALVAAAWSLASPGDIRADEYDIVSVSVSDGSINYGTLALGTTANTTAEGLDDTQIATNTGTVMVDLFLFSSDAAGEEVNWTLASTAGDEQYTHAFSTNDGSTWKQLSSSVNVRRFGRDIDVGEVQSFDMKIGMPTETDDAGPHTITVYVLAEAVE